MLSKSITALKAFYYRHPMSQPHGIGLAFIYSLLALFTLIQAWQGRPLIKTRNEISKTV